MNVGFLQDHQNLEVIGLSLVSLFRRQNRRKYCNWYITKILLFSFLQNQVNPVILSEIFIISRVMTQKAGFFPNPCVFPGRIS